MTPNQIRAERCRRSFFYFVKQFWEVIIPDEAAYNWHIEYLCQEAEKVIHRVKHREAKEYDLIINIPPGTTKSTIMSVMLPAWAWTVDPTLRFITGSYNADLAIDHAVKSRDIISYPKYREFFPDVVIKYDTGVKSHYANTAGGSRVATSVGASVTGKHAHVILIDDPMNPKSAASEVERRNANTWINTSLSTRKINKDVTPTILIMQRLHEDDSTGNWLAKKNKRVRHICLPGELTDSVSPPELRERYVDGLLDPVRLSRNALDDLKVDLGSAEYAGQILQEPSPAEGELLKSFWFKSFKALDLPENLPRNFYTDSAYGKEGSDNSATICYSVYNNNLYIWNVSKKNLGFPDFIKYYKQHLLLNGYSNGSRCYFEPKATGSSMVQQLRVERLDNGSGINVMEDKAPTDSKITRVSGISAMIEAGRVYLLEGASWIDDFLAECIIFPNGKNDDQVDALEGSVRLGLSKNKLIIATANG